METEVCCRASEDKGGCLTRAGPSTCDGVVARGALLLGLLSCARASAHPHGDRSSLWCGRTTTNMCASSTTTAATWGSEAGRIQRCQSSAGSMRLRGGSAWWGRSYPWESVAPSASHNVTDYYGVLEMHHDAPASEIRSSYRKKVLLLHPDRNKNSPDKALKFLEVQEAWDVLGNNDARASYDNFLDKCQNPGLVAEQDALLKQELAAMHREQEEADKAAGWNFGRPATGGGGGSRYGFFGSKRNK